MVDRRRSRRVLPPEPLLTTLRAAEPALIVDLSVHGAQVEVHAPLRPASECSVSLPTGGVPLRLRARVHRCRALLTAEDRGLAYRAGLEFVALQPEQVEALEDVVVDLCLAEVTSASGPPAEAPAALPSVGRPE